MTEPTIITEGLPEGYRIIADEQDGRYYPQRDGARFVLRTEYGDGHSDHPISFEQECQTRRLIALDSCNPRTESWGSIVFTREELKSVEN